MEQKAAIPVNWEAVRALALVVGVRESARRMGISEEAVKKRCTREGWLSSPEAKRVNKMAISERSALTVSPHLSPSALIMQEISALGQKSRLSLARGVSKAAETVENLSGDEILERSADVKNVAQTADLIHGWKEAAPQVKIRLDVLGGTAEPIQAEAMEVESDITFTESGDCDLDDY